MAFSQVHVGGLFNYLRGGINHRQFVTRMFGVRRRVFVLCNEDVQTMQLKRKHVLTF